MLDNFNKRYAFSRICYRGSSPLNLPLFFLCSLYNRDGPEWIDRRRSLNNVFLKTKTVTDNVPVFNDVITDLLDRWQEARSDKGILENVERELYNWSIECTLLFNLSLQL